MDAPVRTTALGMLVLACMGLPASVKSAETIGWVQHDDRIWI
jgi:hypothetical protein